MGAQGGTTSRLHQALADSQLSQEMSAIHFQNSVDMTRVNNITILKDLKIEAKTDRKKTQSTKKKNEDLTPLDFINLIRQDPEMRDEFCYLNRRNHAYDYKIVDYDKRNRQEYMTISARGITHYIENVGEFIKIEQWEKEVKQFHKLGQIQFFKEYKLWKNFYIWKKLTRKNIMKKCQNVLVNSLFILDRHLQKPLLEIKDVSQQIGKLEFADIMCQEPVSIENFREKQDKFRQGPMQQSFDLLETHIKDVIINSCRNSLTAFKVEHRIPNENQNEQSQPLLIGDEQKKDMPYTQEATVKTHYKRLCRYVKLIDYITFNSKVSMIVHSTDILCKNLEDFQTKSSQSRLSPWMICKVTNNDDEILFKPDQQQAVQIMSEIVQKGMEAIVNKTKFFIHRPDIRVFTDSDVDPSKLLDLQSVVGSDANFLQCQKRLAGVVGDLMKLVENYSLKLLPFVKIYKENINQEKLSEDTIELDTFRDLILKHQQQDVQFNTIESKTDLGVFQINCTKLKDQIKNCAQNCLADIYAQLPVILQYRAQQFLMVTQDLNQKLNWTISDNASNFVEYFVQYTANVNKSSEMLQDLSFQIQDINGLLALVQEFKIKIPENYRQKVQEANASITSLRKKTEEAQAQYDQNLTRCGKKLEKQVPEVCERIKSLQEMLYTSNLDDKKQEIETIVDLLKDFKLQIDDMVELTSKINRFQVTLSLEYKHFEKLEELLPEFALIERLWVSRQEFHNYIKKIEQQQFLKIDFQQMEQVFTKLFKSANICAKELELNEVSKVFKSEIEDLQGNMETLRPLLDPAMGQKQWDLVRTICRAITEDDSLFEDIEDPKYSYKCICDLELQDLKEQFSEIALHAAKEAELIKMLENVETFWKDQKITVQPYKNSQEAFILGNNEDMITRLDDTLLTLNNIMASRFVEGIRFRCEIQVRMFRQLQELLDEWAAHQQNYIYLEPILSTNASQMGLQKESSKFKTAEKSWRNIMKRAKEFPFCRNWAEESINRQYFQYLKNNNATFEIIQKALDDYLERKREHFQRFFFLSNDELLEIISSAKSPQFMQPHLRKVFEGVVRVELDSDETTAAAMVSAEGEVVNLKNCVLRGGEVEEWMRIVEEQMRYSLKIATRTSLIHYENEDRKDWVLKHPTQVVLSVDAIYWTKIAEEQYLMPDNCTDEEYGTLDEYCYKIIMDLEEVTELIRGDLNSIHRRILVALVTQDVHYRDIISELYEDGVTKQSDFAWVQQLKFYWEDEMFFAKQVGSRLSYGYEYLGALSRLVITPLTDRCWMTITSALHIKLGSNPAGPAGTGKTESCKDLAKVLGRFCLVFNCSDQINVKMMEKLFIGLCYTGSWTCLDEFNRIYIEVLLIREALLENRATFNFFGKNVILGHNVGIFITMNPGYAGRTELPDNLKLLFRPIAMMVPDYTLIAEIMLFSEGFANAKDLSKKMTMLYKLSSEQLSQQNHYDFGMRAVKSVLVMAGMLKRMNPTQVEDIVLIKAMNDANIPKFLQHDIPLFNAIVQDLFPGVEIPLQENKALKDKVHQIAQESNLQCSPVFQEKVLMFHDTLAVRFGVMLVGPAMAGKSSVMHTLRKSYASLHKDGVKDDSFTRMEYSILNPKSISMDELYGLFDPLTQTWTDGLASIILRKYVQTPEDDKRQWVVFDGPVDALWVENMNSVLDDSMVLCLSNGERIKLHPKIRILFEVADLLVASPATVSRCGMVYIDDKVVTWEHLVESYFTKIPNLNTELQQSLKMQCENLLEKTFTFLKKLGEPIPTSENQLTQKMLRFFDFMLTESLVKNMNGMQDASQKKVMHKLVEYCLVWGLGSHLNDECQKKFLQFCSGFFKASSDGPQGEMFDNFLDFSTSVEGTFTTFLEIVPSFQYDKELSYFQLIVPTKSTVCYNYFVTKFIDIKSHIFITGVTGTGKTIMSQNTLQLLQETVLDIRMSFSSQTASKSVQILLESKLQQQRKKGQIILIPPPGKKLAVLVDDVNMPMVETYGAQPPIELLRQMIDHAGVYDRQGLFFKEIDNYSCVAVAAPPGGGRNQMTQRFTRHFSIFNVPTTTDETLQMIFSNILSGFLKAYAFKGEIQDLETNMVQATLAIYAKISSELLPTPNKSHYTFNLRDVSKVFQGVLMAKPQNFQNKQSMILLWTHECLRVFQDRLINHEDQDWVKHTLQQLNTSYYGENIEDVDSITFADFLKKGVEVENRVYQLADDPAKLKKIIQDFMMEESKLNLVLFKDAIQHLVRICRIMRQQRGHFMLVGVGGSGKKSLSELASVVAGAKMMKVEIQKKYGKKEFRIDIFNIMLQAGKSTQQVMFLFPDTDIIQEGFLEDVNNLINTGEISGLIGREEMDLITAELQEEARVNKINDVYGFFVERVRNQLHIVLAMSPVGDTLRTRFRKFPALISCCTIDWLQPWPSDALFSVASMFLEDVEYQGMTPQLKENLSHMCVHVHLSVNTFTEKFFALMRRQVYTTPKSYIDLVNCYKTLLTRKKEQISNNRQKLSNGLNKLTEANATITDLKAKLVDLQPILLVKNTEIQELIKSLTKDQRVANDVKKVVEAEAREINLQSEKITEMKDEADQILKAAEPILKNAVEQLDKLNRGDISEIKSNNNPHALVKYTIEAVAILLEEKTDWDHIKKNVLSDAGLLGKLKNLKGENITPKTKEKIKKKIADNPLFIPSEMKAINLAAKSLCEWVHAVSSFTDIFKDIQDKQSACKKMDLELASANSALAVKQAELDKVIKKVQQLEKSYNDSKQEKDNLDNEIKQTEARLGRASQLTDGLADEQVRWQDSVQTLKDELDVLLGNVFLAAASVAYYGPFTGQFRDMIVADWSEKIAELEIPCSEDYSLQKMLGNPITFREWNQQGLPSDSISINNGILVTNCMSFPLLIDPQTQANRWIKTKEHEAGLRIAKLSQDTLVKTVEMCLRMGQPLLIEDVMEELSSLLEPLLTKQFTIINNRKMLRIGDADIEFDENFRLYFTTKLQNPHYLPEIFIRVAIINFTVTQEGLQEQLLGDVVKKEMPEVDQVRKELVVEIAQGRLLLKKNEDKILDLLTNSKGMILDDVDLIESLRQSKETAGIVSEKLEIAETKQEEINAAMAKYACVAQRATVLYFVVADLSLIDPMYQFSLNYFGRLYNTIIDNCQTQEDRINVLIKNITLTIFENICRGLFNRHKRILSFLVAAKILMFELMTVSIKEWNALIKGLMVLKPQQVPKPEKATFTDLVWQNFLLLKSENEVYSQVFESMQADYAPWGKWLTAENIHLEPCPMEMDHFQKLLLVNVFRFEKTVYAIDEFVRNVLGERFSTPIVPTMEIVYQDTDFKTPLIFILSPGADPMLNLLRFSKDMKIPQEKFTIISLGQGQGPIAENAINVNIKSGGWVLLQNCHLGKSFMPQLEKKLESLADPEMRAEINPTFRLFLTSMPCTYFPVSVLQNGMKLTNEPPKGLKSNILKTYMNLTNEQMAIANQSENYFKLTFALSLFHAIIQERRKFGPIGWNTRYEFNDSDLDTTLTVLKSLLETHVDVPWDALRFVTGFINYGGRVTDDKDRRCLIAILSKFCQSRILEDEFAFSPSGVYYSPKVGSLQNYKNYIQQLPDEDSPEIFGMNANANINFQITESKQIIEQILSIQPKDGATSQTESPDDQVLALTAAFTERLPNLIRTEEEVNTMDIRFNKLISVMQKSLKEMVKAIKGEILMTPIADEMYNSFLNNMVPQMWKDCSYPSLKSLSTWFDDLIERIAFFENWIQNGKPKAYWISCFFFPQGFLTSVLQNYSRKFKVPVDKLSFKYLITAIQEHVLIAAPPNDGCYIYGLYTEGFRFENANNKTQMEESLPGQIFTACPVIQFIPAESFTPKDVDYLCPVYKTVLRSGTLSTTGSSTNFIINVQLPTSQKVDYWVLQGAALVCALAQ